MKITHVNKHIHLIDLEPVGMNDFIASYVLKGKHVAIVETGPASTVQNLLSGLKELNVKPENVDYVAVSHIHLDHGGGAGTLFKCLPRAKLIVHQRGAPHIANPEKLWAQSEEVLGSIARIYGEPEPVPEDRIVKARDGMLVDIGNGVILKVVETLGHAPHHLSYYEKSSEGIFTGDAAGIYLNKLDVIVPTSPPPFRLDVALASLEKLVNLKPKVLYYSHFGKAHDAVEKLQAYAEQLKLWAEIAKYGIEKGENLKAIRKKILESDMALQKAAEYIRNHLVLSKTVFNQSVEGITEFVGKFGNVNDFLPR
jgi:glyoxylase-like metal-dependent hydrolase (beta-lactamase superfamily II)